MKEMGPTTFRLLTPASMGALPGWACFPADRLGRRVESRPRIRAACFIPHQTYYPSPSLFKENRKLLISIHDAASTGIPSKKPAYALWGTSHNQLGSLALSSYCEPNPPVRFDFDRTITNRR